MTDPIKELRSTSGHRIACLKLSEAVIEIVMTADEEGVDFSYAMRSAIRNNLGLEADKALAENLCLEFVKCCTGCINNELIFKFAFKCYLETKNL